MRYLTVQEINELGYTPHLTFGDKVRSFRTSDSEKLVLYGDLAYEALVLLHDGFSCEAPTKRNRIPSLMC